MRASLHRSHAQIAACVFLTILGVMDLNSVRAQCVEGCTVIHVLQGEAPGDQFGWKSNFLGDLDGDQVNDFVVTSPTNGAGGANAGRVYVYSGASGVELLRMTGTQPGGQLGVDANRAGDVNADGVRDIIAGAPTGTGYVTVYSGVDGSVIQTFVGEAAGDRLGFRVAGDADINGDGIADLLMSAIGHDGAGQNAGRAYVYSGDDFSLICAVDGPTVADQLGTSLSDVGDINGDSRADFVVGARDAGAGGGGQAFVYSYDGATCNLVFTLAPPGGGIDFGHLFADGGRDIDRDGVPDIYVGDFSGNRAYVFSGADGSLIHALSGDGNGQFGLGEMMDDIDGDGHADLVLAAWVSNNGGNQAGKAFIYSGRDGSILEELTHNVPGAQFGFDAKGLGDVNDDGRADYLITAAGDAAQRGTAYVIAGALPPPPPPARLLVTGWLSSNVVAFEADNGAGLDQFITAGLGGLGQPHSIRFGPDRALYVTSIATNRVLRFDADSGAFDSVFVAPGGTQLSNPTDANFGPDGNLYVASFGTGEVLRFDGMTGAFIDVFVTGSGSGRTEMFEWGADGHMYLATGQGNSVERYHGVTGAPLPGPLGAAGTAQFVPPGSGILDSHHLTFGPDGNLYVASMDNASILKFDSATGGSFGAFVFDNPGTGADETGGLSSPHGIAFGPDGDLYVTSFGSNNVLRYNGATGAFIDVFAQSQQLGQPTHLLFAINPADFDGDADADVDDMNTFFSCFTGSASRGVPVCDGTDMDGDGDVDCDDWELFKNHWTGPPVFRAAFAACDTDCNTNGIGDDHDIEMGLAFDCNSNVVPDSCDIADETSLDLDENGVPDECCSPVAPVQPPTAVINNRFLSFTGAETTELQAMRVTFVSLPPPFDVWNDASLWVGPSSEVSQLGSSTVPVVGIPNFNAARLQCEPFFTDWQALGTIHVFHEGIIPGGEYSVQATDSACSDLSNEDSFSEILSLPTAIWGDTVLDLSQTPPLGPEGAVNVVDALAVLGRFSGVPTSIIKPRADLEPGCLDLRINVSDVLASLGGFVGLNYPFTPTALDPCNSTCPNPLP